MPSYSQKKLVGFKPLSRQSRSPYADYSMKEGWATPIEKTHYQSQYGKPRPNYDIIRNDSLTVGTSLKGYVEAHYKELVELFGEPFTPDNDKRNAEWVFRYDGKIYTLYSNTEESPNPKKTWYWHIGGPSTLNGQQETLEFFSHFIHPDNLYAHFYR